MCVRCLDLNCGRTDFICDYLAGTQRNDFVYYTRIQFEIWCLSNIIKMKCLIWDVRPLYIPPTPHLWAFLFGNINKIPKSLIPKYIFMSECVWRSNQTPKGQFSRRIFRKMRARKLNPRHKIIMRRNKKKRNNKEMFFFSSSCSIR